ncbi:unnamed protein product [Choristocarpus tenellus]
MRKLFEGKTVVELGAGCWLSGLVASQFSKTTVLTDGSDVIMRLLQRNIHIQVEENGLAPGKVEARKLVWGEREEVETCTLEFGYPDVLLGADVVCWPQFVGPFLQVRVESCTEVVVRNQYVDGRIKNLPLAPCDKQAI